MASDGKDSVGECNPREAWDALEAEPSAQLIDVRTRPEWSFVGVPDLGPLGRRAILAEWRMFPDMQVNPRFVENLEAEFGLTPPGPLYFLCRSGSRSMEAAKAVAAHYESRGVDVTCVNVAEGFEGDLDENRHRGGRTGWKARGLNWQQS